MEVVCVINESWSCGGVPVIHKMFRGQKRKLHESVQPFLKIIFNFLGINTFDSSKKLIIL